MKRRFGLTLFFTLALSYGAAAQELKDVRPPIPWPAVVPLWMILSALALLLTGWLMWYLASLYKKRRQKAAARPVPSAWEVAYRRLEALQKENLPARGKMEDYYVRLTDIVRRYIEDRFSIRAPEMTTDEFLISLTHGGQLDKTQVTALEEFLRHSDMVKFAREDSTFQQSQASFELARRLVDQTRPVEDTSDSFIKTSS